MLQPNTLWWNTEPRDSEHTDIVIYNADTNQVQFGLVVDNTVAIRDSLSGDVVRTHSSGPWDTDDWWTPSSDIDWYLGYPLVHLYDQQDIIIFDGDTILTGTCRARGTNLLTRGGQVVTDAWDESWSWTIVPTELDQ